MVAEEASSCGGVGFLVVISKSGLVSSAAVSCVVWLNSEMSSAFPPSVACCSPVWMSLFGPAAGCPKTIGTRISSIITFLSSRSCYGLMRITVGILRSTAACGGLLIGVISFGSRFSEAEVSASELTELLRWSGFSVEGLLVSSSYSIGSLSSEVSGVASPFFFGFLLVLLVLLSGGGLRIA